MQEKKLPVIKRMTPTFVEPEKSKPTVVEDKSERFAADQIFGLAQKGMDMAPKVIDLAKIWMEGKVKSDARRHEIDKIFSEIKKIDSEAASYFRKAEANMLKEKEITEQLRDILNFLTKNGYPPEVGEQIIKTVLNNRGGNGA